MFCCTQIVSILYSYRVELRAAFAMFDLDGSGKVNRSEFRAGVAALSQHLDCKLDVFQIEVLMRHMDRDGDGLLDFNEFLAGFSIVDASRDVDDEDASAGVALV